MATIPDSALVVMRRRVAARLSEVDYDKAAANASLQALEDWYESARGDANTAINAATDLIAAPRLSASVKKMVGGMFLAYKAAKELE